MCFLFLFLVINLIDFLLNLMLEVHIIYNVGLIHTWAGQIMYAQKAAPELTLYSKVK